MYLFQIFATKFVFIIFIISGTPGQTNHSARSGNKPCRAEVWSRLLQRRRYQDNRGDQGTSKETLLSKIQIRLSRGHRRHKSTGRENCEPMRLGLSGRPFCAVSISELPFIRCGSCLWNLLWIARCINRIITIWFRKKQVIFNELCHYILTLSSPSDGENYLKNNSINKYLLCQDKFAVQEIIERHK